MFVKFDQTADGVIELIFSRTAEESLFHKVASVLEKDFHAAVIQKLDGLDQRYWDYKIGSHQITLHLEQMLGVSLYPASRESNDFITKIGKHFLTVLDGARKYC